MVKKEKVKKLIDQAIQNCDNSLKNVKALLQSAKRELDKKEKNKKNKELIGWKFDIKSSKLQNLSIEQRNKIIKNIDNMISLEKNSNKKDLEFFNE